MANANQLHQIAPKATVKPTNKTLVSYSQHRITPVGCVSLPVRYKGRAVHAKFYVIENRQKPILSGKVCQVLNLIQHVHKLDTSLQELLKQQPELEHASGAMPGTYSIKIDPTAKPVVQGPADSLQHFYPKSRRNSKRWRKKDIWLKSPSPQTG